MTWIIVKIIVITLTVTDSCQLNSCQWQNHFNLKCNDGGWCVKRGQTWKIRNITKRKKKSWMQPTDRRRKRIPRDRRSSTVLLHLRWLLIAFRPSGRVRMHPHLRLVSPIPRVSPLIRTDRRSPCHHRFKPSTFTSLFGSACWWIGVRIPQTEIQRAEDTISLPTESPLWKKKCSWEMSIVEVVSKTSNYTNDCIRIESS